MKLRDAPALGAKERRLVLAIRGAARPIVGARTDHDPLLELIGDARFVLLGEATHGTHDFYRERGEITKRLILEKGFHAVAVEGDWPDCGRVNRFVRGRGADEDAAGALSDFRRFPSWMWRNADVADFVAWLRAHDEAMREPDAKVGFYGLDLYAMHASAAAVVGYLEKIDPVGAARARERYECFDQFGPDPQNYGLSTVRGHARGCEDEVLRQLVELQRRRGEYLSRDGRVASDEFFFAEQNARLVKNAETYYRTMFEGRVNSWNVRDSHMAETLDALVRHLDSRVGAGRSKVVVWAHNSHVGDARATWMARAGELNVGQLARERWGRDAFLVGFTTHEGTVTAASDWGGDAERKRVRPSLPGSCERLFHLTGVPRFFLGLRDAADGLAPLAEERLQRAIGVVYRPDTERRSHWFETHVTEQFDAVLHFDETRAVEPLERTSLWEEGEAPETWPTGL